MTVVKGSILWDLQLLQLMSLCCWNFRGTTLNYCESQFVVSENLVLIVVVFVACRCHGIAVS